ncbi:RidA family protein [Ignavigranum ruoffiae]|uniref:RidA family protein n=1 Tax=Ignavigranum ruoffiae TaxID=89093 RepID=UPI0023555163|nr:RidA family protein [Ignavigranum ruoffiae]
MKTIESQFAPQPVGAYSQAIESGNLVFLSGQIGIDREIGKLVEGDIEAQTKQVFKNIQYVLEEAGLSLANVVKVTVLLADINDFQAMNTIYAEAFAGLYPARSAFSVAGLPLGAKVEIEVIAERA